MRNIMPAVVGVTCFVILLPVIIIEEIHYQFIKKHYERMLGSTYVLRREKTPLDKDFVDTRVD